MADFTFKGITPQPYKEEPQPNAIDNTSLLKYYFDGYVDLIDSHSSEYKILPGMLVYPSADGFLIRHAVPNYIQGHSLQNITIDEASQYGLAVGQPVPARMGDHPNLIVMEGVEDFDNHVEEMAHNIIQGPNGLGAYFGHVSIPVTPDIAAQLDINKPTDPDLFAEWRELPQIRIPLVGSLQVQIIREVEIGYGNIDTEEKWAISDDISLIIGDHVIYKEEYGNLCMKPIFEDVPDLIWTVVEIVPSQEMIAQDVIKLHHLKAKYPPNITPPILQKSPNNILL